MQFFYSDLDETHRFGTLVPGQAPADARASGTYAEIVLPPDSDRWQATVYFQGAMIFHARGNATPASVTQFASDAIARERFAELVGLTSETSTP